MTFYKDGRIYYDSIGNPTQYYNSASFEWAKGRQLQRVQLADGTYLSFRYNDEGVRTRKTVNGVETYFYLDGTNILAQKTGSDILWFNYDANGTRISITMPNGAVYYYYAYNAQGDVIGLYSVNEYGYFVPQVYYTYDAWGKVLSITGNMADTLGQQNPFRYRGYYYDSETQFYYLNSRYYDPEVGRFINADGYVKAPTNSLLATNMYAYCENNPANKFDQTGDFALTATLGGIALWKIGAAIIGMVTALVLVDSLVKNPPTFSTITIDAKPKAEAKDKTRDITLSNSRRDPIHHIVAKADPRAAESRKILRDVGIEPVTDMRNLVTLPQSYHVSLHTTAYHNYVTERLRPVAGDKAGVEATLASLKAEILARSAAGIRWD